MWHLNPFDTMCLVSTCLWQLNFFEALKPQTEHAQELSSFLTTFSLTAVSRSKSKDSNGLFVPSVLMVSQRFPVWTDYATNVTIKASWHNMFRFYMTLTITFLIWTEATNITKPISVIFSRHVGTDNCIELCLCKKDSVKDGRASWSGEMISEGFSRW